MSTRLKSWAIERDQSASLDAYSIPSHGRVSLIVSIEKNSPSLTDFTAGCMLTFISAAVTCAMLFLNGAIVFACLRAFSKTGAWFRNPQVMQFMLLFLPVVMAIFQWMLIDYFRTRFWRTPGSAKR